MYKKMGAIFGFSSTVRPPHQTHLVQIARGSGATVGNSVVIPSMERAVAFSVDDYSPGSAWAISTTSTPPRLRRRATAPISIDGHWPSRRLGDDPPTKISDYRNYDGSWSRHVVDSSADAVLPRRGVRGGALWRVNRNLPRFPERRLRPGPKEAASRLDPRATVAAARGGLIPSRRASSTAWRLDATRARRGCWTSNSSTGQMPSVDGSIAHDGSTHGSSCQDPPRAGPTHGPPGSRASRRTAISVRERRGATITPLTRSDHGYRHGRG